MTDWDSVTVTPAGPKIDTHIRLDREVVEHFRAGGPGYQTRIGDVLKAYVRHAEGAAKDERSAAAIADHITKAGSTIAALLAEARELRRILAEHRIALDDLVNPTGGAAPVRRHMPAAK